MLNAQGKHGGDTLIDLVQGLKTIANTASEEHQRLDKIKKGRKSKKNIKRQGGAYHDHRYKGMNVSDSKKWMRISSTSTNESLAG
jgi:hypothetical protein